MILQGHIHRETGNDFRLFKAGFASEGMVMEGVWREGGNESTVLVSRLFA
jgi:hypothetical protein